MMFLVFQIYRESSLDAQSRHLFSISLMAPFTAVKLSLLDVQIFIYLGATGEWNPRWRPLSTSELSSISCATVSGSGTAETSLGGSGRSLGFTGFTTVSTGSVVSSNILRFFNYHSLRHRVSFSCLLPVSESLGGQIRCDIPLTTVFGDGVQSVRGHVTVVPFDHTTSRPQHPSNNLIRSSWSNIPTPTCGSGDGYIAFGTDTQVPF